MSQNPERNYWKLMFGKSEDDVVSEHQTASEKGCKSQLLEAYEKAHDVRKFEIDLYWKRALYFWGFEAAFLVAFGQFLTTDDYEKQLVPLLLLSLFSFVYTVLWCFALQGMKRWQENWEIHIDFLEKNISGCLYKTVLYKKNIQFGFYSVSRINEMVAVLLAVMWLFSATLFSIQLHLGIDKWFGQLEKWLPNVSINIFLLVSCGAATLGVLVWMLRSNFKGHDKALVGERTICRYRGPNEYWTAAEEPPATQQDQNS